MTLSLAKIAAQSLFFKYLNAGISLVKLGSKIHQPYSMFLYCWIKLENLLNINAAARTGSFGSLLEIPGKLLNLTIYLFVSTYESCLMRSGVYIVKSIQFKKAF